MREAEWPEAAPQLGEDPGRSYAGAVGVGDRVWLVGGFDGENCLNSVMVLNTVTGRWRRGPDMQIARSGLGCEYLDGWVYAVGGMGGVSRGPGTPPGRGWRT